MRIVGGILFVAIGLGFVAGAILLNPNPSVDNRDHAANYFCRFSGLLLALAGGKLLYDARHAV